MIKECGADLIAAPDYVVIKSADGFEEKPVLDELPHAKYQSIEWHNESQTELSQSCLMTLV